MIDFSAFVGLPYRPGGRDPSGVDCWGLVFLVLRAAGVDAPAYSDHGINAADARGLAALIAGELPAWVPVPAGQERPLDAVLMRDGRTESHVGIVVSPGFLLHIERGHASRIERYRTEPIRRRVVGFYRFEGP